MITPRKYQINEYPSYLTKYEYSIDSHNMSANFLGNQEKILECITPKNIETNKKIKNVSNFFYQKKNIFLRSNKLIILNLI